MSKIVAIAPGADIIEEVSRHLVQRQGDYSGNLIVFPGKRPAHYLRKLLGVREKKSYLPPRIFSIDTFINFLYEQQLGLVQRELQPVDAVALLHDIYLQSSDRFGGTGFDELDAFLPLGLRLFNELEELKMAHLPARRVREVISSVTVGNLRPLSSIYQAFYDEVNRLAYCTRGLKYAVVADFLNEQHLASFERIVAAGFFGFTNAEKVIFRKIGRISSATFVFQYLPGLEEHLGQAGFGKFKPPARQTQTPHINFHRAPDSHGQVFGLTGLIKKQIQLDGPPDERTVVVLPASETLLPIYHQTLPLLQANEYNISLGYPVTRTPVYGFLESIMNMVGAAHEGRFYAPEYLKFLLHPYTKNILYNGRADATRIVVHAIEEHFASGKIHAFFTLEELEGDVAFFDKVAQRVSGGGIDCTPRTLREHLTHIHANTIRKVMDVAAIGRLAQGFTDALLFIDEHSTAQYHPLFRPYVESIIDAFNGVASSLLAKAEVRDVGAAFTFLRRCLIQTSVPFAGTPLNGLQVLGFLETRNVKFKTVYFIDANEDVLPGTGSEHTIIPEPIRDRLGLPTRRQRDQIAAYYFQLLVLGAQEVHLFFSDSPQRERSRFVEQLLWDRQYLEDKDGVDEYINNISYAVSLANSSPPPVPKTQGIAEALHRLSYSATALDTYLACGLRFYYRYVLGLREREEVEGDIDSGDVGGFVHDILRNYFFPAIGRELTLQDIDVIRLQLLINEGFDARFGGGMTAARYVLKRQVSTQLRRFLESYQKPFLERQPAAILALEQKHEIEWNGFRVNGKLDRVEQRGDITHILDYKTGNPERIRVVEFDKLDPKKRETWKHAISSLQLPVYALLYSAASGTTIEEILPAYVKLGESAMNVEIELPLFDESSSPAVGYRQVLDVIDLLLHEIVDPNIPFTSTDDFENDCTYCPFQSICGTQWTRMGMSR